MTFEFGAEGDHTRLTMVHDRLDPASGIGGGWASILAGPQRVLEAESAAVPA